MDIIAPGHTNSTYSRRTAVGPPQSYQQPLFEASTQASMRKSQALGKGHGLLDEEQPDVKEYDVYNKFYHAYVQVQHQCKENECLGILGSTKQLFKWQHEQGYFPLKCYRGDIWYNDEPI